MLIYRQSGTEATTLLLSDFQQFILSIIKSHMALGLSYRFELYNNHVGPIYIYTDSI